MSKSVAQGPSWTALTNVASFELNFDWTINNFLEVEKLPGECLSSQDFGGPTKFAGIQCQARAIVYPTGADEENKDYLSVYLALKIEPENDAYEIMARYEVSILGVHGQKLQTLTMELKDYSTTSSIWGYPSFILLSEFEKRKNELLPGGNLKLQFKGEVWITLDSTIKKDSKAATPPVSNDSFPTRVMKNLYESENGSDVVIKAGDREFKCHKNVLSSSSEYFRAMFESGMKESQEGMVDFSDLMDGDVLKDLLEYFYLGKAGNLKETCLIMMKIADMFHLEELKSQSEEMLIEVMNPSNAWDIMMLARELGAKKLQRKALLFLAKSIY